MTVLSVLTTDMTHGGEAERPECVQCDVCLPPEITIGTPDELRASGWLVDEDRHTCPLCRRRGEAHRLRHSRPQPNPALPNLIVIGSAKSGTTSLHHYLSLHPEIFMSSPKELRFFQRPSDSALLEEYATFFDGGARVRGESSPVYTESPLVKGVAARMRELIPDAKLIYVVRDPVDRALAVYRQWRAGGLSLSIEEAFGDPANPFNRFVLGGRYASQLEPFVEAFGWEQIRVIDQADLLTDRRATLQALFGFLGVADDYYSPKFARTLNITDDKRRPLGAVRWLRDTSVGEALMRTAGRHEALLRGPVKRALSRPVEPSGELSAARERVRLALQHEVDRFRTMTDMRFEDWTL